MNQKQPCVYMLASKIKGTLYTGVTSDLAKRVWQHQTNLTEGFTQKYSVKILVYCEFHDTMEAAIIREKQIKKWRRQWKINLIEKDNPNWVDLYETILR